MILPLYIKFLNYSIRNIKKGKMMRKKAQAALINYYKQLIFSIFFRIIVITILLKSAIIFRI